MAVSTTAAVIGGGAILGSALLGSRAADKAASQQAGAADRATAATLAMSDRSRADLAPFTRFGGSHIDQLAEMLTPEGQFNFISKHPFFNMALERADRSSNNAFLSAGLEGDAREALASNVMFSALPLLESHTSNLFNAVGIGQASAAGQANIAQNTGSNISNLLLQKGNAQAAGTIGSANAISSGISDAMSLYAMNKLVG